MKAKGGRRRTGNSPGSVRGGMTPTPSSFTPSGPFIGENVENTLPGLGERSTPSPSVRLDKTLSGTGPSSIVESVTLERTLERAHALAAVIAPPPPTASSAGSDFRDHASESGARIVAATDREQRIESERPPQILVPETPAIPPVTLREAREAVAPAAMKTVMGPFSDVRGTFALPDTPQPRTSVEVDEGSVPPVTTTPGLTGDLDEHFFAEGERASDPRLHLQTPEPPPEEDPRASQKMTVAVRARRARFAKYVQFAVAFCAVVCVMALVRLVVARVRAPEAEARADVAQVAATQVAAALAAQPAAPAEPTPPVAAPPAEKPSEPAPAAPAAVSPAAPAAGTAATPEPTGKTALQEKNDARKALERGKLGEAIEAGERSIALDPTDADAYLLTGAAYLEKGKNADARRIFQACVKEAKKGPRGECGAMLR
jgi:hypothetical protein